MSVSPFTIRTGSSPGLINWTFIVLSFIRYFIEFSAMRIFLVLQGMDYTMMKIIKCPRDRTLNSSQVTTSPFCFSLFVCHNLRYLLSLVKSNEYS